MVEFDQIYSADQKFRNGWKNNTFLTKKMDFSDAKWIYFGLINNSIINITDSNQFKAIISDFYVLVFKPIVFVIFMNWNQNIFVLYQKTPLKKGFFKRFQTFDRHCIVQSLTGSVFSSGIKHLFEHKVVLVSSSIYSDALKTCDNI